MPSCTTQLQNFISNAMTTTETAATYVLLFCSYYLKTLSNSVFMLFYSGEYCCLIFIIFLCSVCSYFVCVCKIVFYILWSFFVCRCLSQSQWHNDAQPWRLACSHIQHSLYGKEQDDKDTKRIRQNSRWILSWGPKDNFLREDWENW